MRREIVPAELIVPAQPVLEPRMGFERRQRGQPVTPGVAQSIDMRGINTRPTSVAEAERVSRSVCEILDRAISPVGDRGRRFGRRSESAGTRHGPECRDTVSRWISNGSGARPSRSPRGTNYMVPPCGSRL